MSSTGWTKKQKYNFRPAEKEPVTVSYGKKKKVINAKATITGGWGGLKVKGKTLKPPVKPAPKPAAPNLLGLSYDSSDSDWTIQIRTEQFWLKLSKKSIFKMCFVF